MQYMLPCVFSIFRKVITTPYWKDGKDVTIYESVCNCLTSEPLIF